MQRDKKHNIVYKTTNLINGKIYIGVHCTDILEDGYIGCGIYRQNRAYLKNNTFHKAVRKYGYDSFKRDILYEFETSELAFWWESYLVDKEFIKRKDVYNSSVGGRGGCKHNRNTGKKISNTLKSKGIAPYNKGLVGSECPYSKKIRCITTNEIFNSLMDACKKYNRSLSCLCGHLKKRSKSAGKLPDGTKLVWEYYHEQ